MKCQKCKLKNATTQVKRVINGEYEEYMLCADCAHEMGFDNVFDSTMPDMFGGLLSGIFSAALPARSGATRCPQCSSTYGDIRNTGKVGCAKCYEVFISELMPSLSRIHGNTVHCGKSPAKISDTSPQNFVHSEVTENTEVTQLDELRDKLQLAIKEQNFEYAAELRDKIKELEGN